jgi:hypothetical protein
MFEDPVIRFEPYEGERGWSYRVIYILMKQGEDRNIYARHTTITECMLDFLSREEIQDRLGEKPARLWFTLLDQRLPLPRSFHYYTSRHQIDTLDGRSFSIAKTTTVDEIIQKLQE